MGLSLALRVSLSLAASPVNGGVQLLLLGSASSAGLPSGLHPCGCESAVVPFGSTRRQAPCRFVSVEPAHPSSTARGAPSSSALQGSPTRQLLCPCRRLLFTGLWLFTWLGHCAYCAHMIKLWPPGMMAAPTAPRTNMTCGAGRMTCSTA